MEQWQIEWAEKGENRAIAHRKMLEAVLAHPDNEPEKALQKTLKVSNDCWRLLSTHSSSPTRYSTSVSVRLGLESRGSVVDCGA